MASNAVAKENDEINKLEQELANIMGEDGEVTPPNTNEVDPGPVEPTIPDNVEEEKENGTKFEDTTTIKDGQDNDVTIPGDFHIAEDSGTNVEDGIVIEDDAGNQFVWIPVGTYHTTKGDKTNNLSRRKFTKSGAKEVSGDSVIGAYYYGEEDSRSIAYNTIGAFKTSATLKGGFYIGRYEAGTETERKSKSTPLTAPLVKKNKYPYMNVTRDQANTQAQVMYGGNGYVKSELISGYAWDTALNFICQTNSAGYTLAKTTDDSYGNIGTNSRTKTGMYIADKYSNVYDMLGNCYEWTTEYSSYSISSRYIYPCVHRGGYYPSNAMCASDYYFSAKNNSSVLDSFRIQLYVK